MKVNETPTIPILDWEYVLKHSGIYIAVNSKAENKKYLISFGDGVVLHFNETSNELFHASDVAWRDYNFEQVQKKIQFSLSN